MTKGLDFLGFIPGPYGKDIAVHRDDNSEDGYCFNLDASMDFAGIYHQCDRDACSAAAKGRGRLSADIFFNYGGHPIPKEKLIRPKAAIYPTLPLKAAPGLPIEAWVTMAMESPSWKKRADSFLNIIGGNLDAAGEWRDILAIALQQVLTATLEHLPDTEIDCLEAAAFFALTVHDEWIDAGLRWLTPFKATWFKDWAKNHTMLISARN